MQDKELKKELDKIPDVDENGDPIYKIDAGGGDPSEQNTEKDSKIPLFMRDTPDAPHGNAQDIKDSTEED